MNVKGHISICTYYEHFKIKHTLQIRGGTKTDLAACQFNKLKLFAIKYKHLC